MNSEKFKLIKHKITGKVFRAVYFDGSIECYKRILPLINKYYDGFVETWNPIKIYHQFSYDNYKRHYSIILPEKYWLIVSHSDKELKEVYNLNRYINNETFNEFFNIC